MTNFELWKEYTSGSASPDNYLDWGYRYLIAACLQRRVWLSASHAPCYPNIYPILVGRPGVGKGQCIRLVDDILRHHKLEAGVSSAAKTDD